MMRVQTLPCSLAKAEANTLNRESGRHYTNTLVWHYRIYRAHRALALGIRRPPTGGLSRRPNDPACPQP